MNSRRQPFQFTSIDPAKRHAELQKRFGLPANDMFVDSFNPSIMGAGLKEPTSLESSPRLPRKVPMFSEESLQGKLGQDVDAGYKPRVRVIPIQVEGVNEAKRHRTLSGSSGLSNRESRNIFPEPTSHKIEPSTISVHVNNVKNQPKVCNIPIQIEPKVTESVKSDVSSNGLLNSQLEVPSKTEEKKSDSEVDIQMKKIETVLDKLKSYKIEVEQFSGTLKDKQYRYLDEMLTRLMLDLDNVETLGLESIRSSRKAAVRQVQECVDLLDHKINPSMLEGREQEIKISNENVEMDAEMVKDSGCNRVEENPEIEFTEPVLGNLVQEVELSESSVQESENISELIVEEIEDLTDKDLESVDENYQVAVTEVSECEGMVQTSENSIDFDKPSVDIEMGDNQSVEISELNEIDNQMQIDKKISEEQLEPLVNCIQVSKEHLQPVLTEFSDSLGIVDSNGLVNSVVIEQQLNSESGTNKLNCKSDIDDIKIEEIVNEPAN